MPDTQQPDPIREAIARDLEAETDRLADVTRQEVEVRLLLTAAQDAAYEAWEPAEQYDRVEDIPSETQAEIERTRAVADSLERRYDTVRQTVARTQAHVDRLADPAEYDRRVARRESGREVGRRISMASKKTKVTAKDQGVPEVYLSESGNFKPGYDARLKSDLIKAVLDETPEGVLHTFTAAEAQELLEKRGWLNFLAKSRNAREAKAAREKKAAEKKAAAEAKKDKPKRTAKPKATPVAEATEPTADVEVTPDPKPVKKEKKRGGRIAA